MRHVIALVPLLAMSTSCASPAKVVPPVPVAFGTAKILGEVRDTVSGMAIVRADLCAEFNTADGQPVRRCVKPDTLGKFEMTGLPAPDDCSL